MRRPARGARREGGHIGSTCCFGDTWAESDAERLIGVSVNGEKDEHAAALWAFFFSFFLIGAEAFEVFWIRTILRMS